ncbi:MAG: dihydrolipoyl dehydrogenase [Candidatus Caldarchaeum sp.]|jgi:dihydrolipoamide dehydrogenase
MNFDAVVVGGGPGGYSTAIRLSQLGLKTALVEKEHLGGECTNWGCIPSKHLITQAKKIHSLMELLGSGLVTGEITVTMPKITESTQQVVQRLRQGISYLLKTYGVTVYKGEAEITSPGMVKVSSNGGKESFEARNIVVATGTVQSSLPAAPYDGKRIIGYKEALYLGNVPKKMLVVGGGAIGVELGTAYRHLGSEVTIVELMDQLLPGIDPDAARLLKRGLEKKGVKIHLKTTVEETRYVDGGVEALLSNDVREVFDIVLVVVGKRPSEWVRKLADLGVKLGEKGYVLVDSGMKTSVDGIYAVGDVTGPPFLAHKAYRQATVAAENIAGKKSSYDGLVPFGVFTSPEVATVGLTVAAAREKGYDPVEARFPYAALGRAVADNEDGFVKIIFDKKTDKVFGATVVGPHATETVSILTTLIKLGATVDEASEIIHIHPTYSEAVGEAMHLAHKRSIHYVTR